MVDQGQPVMPRGATWGAIRQIILKLLSLHTEGTLRITFIRPATPTQNEERTWIRKHKSQRASPPNGLSSPGRLPYSDWPRSGECLQTSPTPRLLDPRRSPPARSTSSLVPPLV